MVEIRKAAKADWDEIWQIVHDVFSLGFEIFGTLPKAFNHKSKGLVDAHVMFQVLT